MERKNPHITFKIIPARYIVAVMGSCALAIVYGLRVNLSVAIVGMLNHTAIRLQIEGPKDSGTEGASSKVKLTSNEECPSYGDNDKVEQDGPFTWPSTVQGMILSCYFWGYFVAQIPGGRIAEDYSAKWVLFFSVFINGLCTVLTPPMCQVHYAAVVVMRVLEGVGGGTAFPAIHCLLSKWAPPSERSFIGALTYAGTSLGIVTSMLATGVLTAHVGWESSFYVMGGLTLVWCAMWLLLIKDSPQQLKWMTDEERNMIVKSLGNTVNQSSHKNMTVPWRDIVSSKAFLAILIAHSCSNVGWYMLIIQLPFYMKQVLKFNMTENALAVALPFLSLWVFSMLLSRLLDWLRSKSIITTTSARKIATMFASVMPAGSFIAICFIGCNRAAAVGLMAFAITCIGGMFCGFLTNHIDISPNFAGTLMAITNTVATIPGIIVPFFVSYITHGNQTMGAWRIIFLATVAMYIIEVIVYTLFGSGEVQPWNQVQSTNR